MIVLPPSLDGADQARVTWPLPRVAVSPVGAPGTFAEATGVADAGADAGPVPTALVAVTVKLYAVPFVNPVTVQPVVADRAGRPRPGRR